MRRTKKEKPVSKTLTAAQKIERLEKNVDMLINVAKAFNTELEKLAQVNVNLNKKIDAALKVANEGTITEKKVEEYLINEQILELKNKLEILVNEGVLVSSELIDTNSFVVGKELSKDGEIVSPRTQAEVSKLAEDVKNAMIGKKVGDLVEFTDDKLSFLVDEIYSINVPEEKSVDFAETSENANL